MSKKRNIESPVKLIAKSNRLIEARHNLDIWELRIFTKMLMLVGADKEALDFMIPIRDIIKDFELPDNQQSYQYLRTAADKLLGRKVYIYKQIDQSRWERQATTLIKKYAVPVVQLEDGTFSEELVKDRYIRIGFDEDVRDLILHYRDNFTRLNLNVLAKLSPKSFRMYELLKQYEDTGFRTMTVDEIRDIFDVTDQYSLYGNIKQRIIDKAKSDLDAYADITFTYDEIKNGKSVHRLNFHIKSKKDKNTALPLMKAPKAAEPDLDMAKLSPEKLETIEKTWQVTPSVYRQLFKKYDADRLEKAFNFTSEALATGKITESVAGFFVKAVKEGFSKPEPPPKPKVTKPEPDRVAEQRAAIEAEKRRQFEIEKTDILEKLKTDSLLQQEVMKRLKQGIFHGFYEADKSFFENLEKPALYGAAANIVKDISQDPP
jgi:plasmid replication initiation protein